MEADRVRPFQITFLRPSSWERDLFDVEEKASVEPGRFREEVYTWEPAESIWDSIQDANVTDHLRELLVEGFSPDRSDDERSLEALQNVLEEIRKVIAEKKAGWKTCQQTDDDGDFNLQANLLLSFLHHLTWVCNVFADVPGISIIVR